MSKGSFLCSLVLLQVCIVQLSLISSSQLTGGQIRDELLCQDPIRRAQLMSSHGRDEFDGHSTDLISDEELTEEGVDTGDEYASDDGGVAAVGGEAVAEEEEGLLLLDGDDYGETKDSSGSGGDVECPECGKLFKNDKSMFGHLRSHPNRGYKGATPPVKKLKLSPETAATPSSSSSPGTDRLPAKRLPAKQSGHNLELTPLEILCAYGLLTLKYRGNNQATQVPRSPPSFGKLDAVGHAEGGIRGSATGNAAADLKFTGNNAGAETGNLGISDGHSGSFVKIPKKRRNMPKEVGEAHRKKVKFVPTPKEKRPYVCKHCKAEFSTHQSLGGHMAGHHREKVPTHQVMAAESQNGKHQVRGGSEDGNHWRGNVLSLQRGLPPEQFSMAMKAGQCGQAPPALTTPTPTPTDGADRRRLFNIDLNVEAQEQEYMMRKSFACSEKE